MKTNVQTLDGNGVIPNVAPKDLMRFTASVSYVLPFLPSFQVLTTSAPVENN